MTRDYDIAGSGLNTIDYDKSRTYYYFSFKDTASLNTYAKIIQILSLRNSLIILLMHRNAVLQRKMIILRNLSL